MAQKVGRREKLAQKVGRREIYPPVPPPSSYDEQITIAEIPATSYQHLNVALRVRIRDETPRASVLISFFYCLRQCLRSIYSHLKVK